VVARQLILGVSGVSWVCDGVVSLADSGFLLQWGAHCHP
jgi:hypothetical protein